LVTARKEDGCGREAFFRNLFTHGGSVMRRYLGTAMRQHADIR
jgi:hypothetical protein